MTDTEGRSIAGRNIAAPRAAFRRAGTTQDTGDTTMTVAIEGRNTLMAASNEWANRPADERYSSLESLDAAVRHHRDCAVEARGVNLRTLQVDAESQEEPVLIGAGGTRATFTHHAFTQFARRIGAPAHYLRTLPPALVASNMNHGLRHTDNDNDSLLFTQNGSLKLRASLSGQYTRIWNADITSRLQRLVYERPEWQPAPAAFDGSRGLYASDEDMFAFLVDNDRRIFEHGPAGGLGRGFFVSNSEVGTGAFAITTFFYEYVCGNHRVWGAQGVKELRIRHVGNADDRAFDELGVELTKYADASAADDEAKVMRMRTKVLGRDKDAVLDAVFGLRIRDLGKKVIDRAYDVAVAEEAKYGDPRTVWGLTGGLTQIARDLPNTNDRVTLERAAGKIMQIAF